MIHNAYNACPEDLRLPTVILVIGSICGIYAMHGLPGLFTISGLYLLGAMLEIMPFDEYDFSKSPILAVNCERVIILSIIALTIVSYASTVI